MDAGLPGLFDFTGLPVAAPLGVSAGRGAKVGGMVRHLLALSASRQRQDEEFQRRRSLVRIAKARADFDEALAQMRRVQRAATLSVLLTEL